MISLIRGSERRSERRENKIKQRQKNQLIDREQISCYQSEKGLEVGKMSSRGQLTGDAW